MTDFLKDALKASKGMSNTEVIKSLKSAYISKRQIGAAEAIYRINQGMKLKDSNVKCTFVATGFPEKRWTLFRKVHDGEDDSDDREINMENESEEHVEPIQNDGPTVEIPGRSGKFRETITIHDRYKNRPSGLEELTLAQFATIYEAKKTVPKKIVFVNGMSEDEGIATVISNSEQRLPRYMKLNEDNLGYMSLRGQPSILRLHSSKKKEGHEQYYAEMLLYLPWRDEEADLKRFDPEACESLFNEMKDLIQKNKEGIFPNSGVAETMELLEKEGLLRPQHLYETLNIQGNQENDDDEAQGQEDNRDFAGLDPELLETRDERQDMGGNESYKYRQIQVEEAEELRQMTRQLVPEQQVVLNEIVGFCKETVLARNGHCDEPDPKLLILHGGAGKLTVITRNIYGNLENSFFILLSIFL